MAKIIQAVTEFPEFRYSQKEIMNELKQFWPNHEEIVDRLTETSSVQHRNLVIPLSDYKNLNSFDQRNKIYIQTMQELLKNAVQKLNDETGFKYSDIGLIVSTSITGIAVPALDARLMNELPFNRKLTRMPLFGVGCMGGVSALNRASEYLKLYPNQLALVLAAEACTLTLQMKDVSMANFVACSLFGDGAAAVLLAGDQHSIAKEGKIQIMHLGSAFYSNTERVMGWDLVPEGFKIVLSGNVPEIVTEKIAPDVEAFLSQHQIQISEIENFITHPGGPKVLDAVSKAFKKESIHFIHSWESLRDHGNLSSVSVLNVLERSLRKKTLKPGLGLAMAMGPAFNAEFTLFQVMA